MMKNFTQFLIEDVQPSELRRIRDDIGAFSKNIRRIKTPEDMAVVAEAFRVWCENLEKLMYRIGIFLGKEKKNENWYEKNLRYKIWAVTSESRFFIRDYLSLLHFGMDDRELYSGNKLVYTNRNKEMWEILYHEFDKNRNKMYDKFGRITREATKAIEEYLGHKAESADKTIPDQHIEIPTTIEGYPLTVVHSETDDFIAKRTSEVVAILREAIQILKRNGMTPLLRKIRFEYADDPKLNSGVWFLERRTVKATQMLSNPGTIVHEVGHAFYDLEMTKKQRDEWRDFITRNRLFFDETELTNLHMTFRSIVTDTNIKDLVTDTFWLSTFAPAIKDTFLKQKFMYFLTSNQEISTWTVDGVEGMWKRAMFDLKEPFVARNVSKYANTNELEAFAETFAKYILRKPIEPFFRAIFEDISLIRKYVR